MSKPPLSIGFNLPFSEAIRAAEERGTVLPDVYYGQLQGLARQKAFSIAGIAAIDQLQAVNDSLQAWMEKGGSFNDWKKQSAVLDLNLPAYRLETIWRTNLQGNYMRGRWEQFIRNAELRPYLLFDSINDSRTRPSHLAHDGAIRPVGDPFWKTHSPPLGFSCRCSLLSISEAQASARSGFNAKNEGLGLNKVPTNEDGSLAEPDPGWDYHPYEDGLKPWKPELSRFQPKFRQAAEKVMAGADDTAIIKTMTLTPQNQLDERAESILTALAARAVEASPTSASGLLEALWTNSNRYLSHLAKRLGNEDIQDATDYALKTFAVLTAAERMLLVVADNDYASGKLQAEAQGWIVLLGNHGHIITSHPFDPDKTTFEDRHKQAGESVHEHFISTEIRKILAGLFARY